MVHKDKFKDTACEFKAFVIDIFSGVLQALQENRLDKSEYANEKWPVKERLSDGQDKLKDIVIEMHGFYNDFKKEAEDPSHPLFKHFRRSRGITAKNLEEALRSRGVNFQQSMKKGQLALALAKHCTKHREIDVLGYEGELPDRDYGFVHETKFVEGTADAGAGSGGGGGS